MCRPWKWIICLVALALAGAVGVHGQETSSSTESASAPDLPSEPSPSGTGNGPSGVPAASSFGTTTPENANPAPNTSGPTATPAVPPASSFGTGTTAPSGEPSGTTPTTPTEAPPPTFTLPTAYGSVPQTYTLGQGRFARPRFRYTGSVTFGLDDNVLTAPFNGRDTPAVTEEVITQAAVPAQTTVVTIFPAGRGGFFGQRPQQIVVTTPEQPEKTKTVVLQKAIPAADRIASFVARAVGGVEMQFGTRRSIFTMDLNGSASYYPSRPQDKVDYNGSFNLGYVYKITPRLQFGASANLAYLSQPDISRVNAPLNNVGDYFSGSVRLTLSYGWTKRFNTTATLQVDSTLYNSASFQASDFYETLVGLEGHYLISPRMSLLGELRYGMVTFKNNSANDTHSIYVLGGGEIALTRAISASARLGVEIRTFDDQGDSKIGPYAETSVSWRYHHAGGISWTTRTGYEQPQNSNATVQAFRTSLQIVQGFSARLRATGGVSVVHRITTDDAINDVNSENVFSLDAGMEYTWSKNLTLIGSYSFIGDLTTTPNSDYIRNQIFFGIQYAY